VSATGQSRLRWVPLRRRRLAPRYGRPRPIVVEVDRDRTGSGAGLGESSRVVHLWSAAAAGLDLRAHARRFRIVIEYAGVLERSAGTHRHSSPAKSDRAVVDELASDEGHRFAARARFDRAARARAEDRRSEPSIALLPIQLNVLRTSTAPAPFSVVLLWMCSVPMCEVVEVLVKDSEPFPPNSQKAASGPWMSLASTAPPDVAIAPAIDTPEPSEKLPPLKAMPDTQGETVGACQAPVLAPPALPPEKFSCPSPLSLTVPSLCTANSITVTPSPADFCSVPVLTSVGVAPPLRISPVENQFLPGFSLLASNVPLLTTLAPLSP
jgi:hypothetical protein